MNALHLALTSLALALSLHAASGPIVLVAGYDSDNVVQFDLAARRWSEVAQLPKGSQPRGVAVSPTGEIFLGLHGGGKNVVRLVQQDGVYQPQVLTEKIGRFGPGCLLHGGSRIWAAGDTDRVIYEIDPATGGILVPEQFKNPNNIVGLAADNGMLYAAEYFQRSILRYALQKGPLAGERFIAKSEHLDRPIGMTIGHNGNLFVANALKPTIVEFDRQSGAYVRTLADIGAAGQAGIHALLYAADVQRYFLAAGSDVHELDTEGKIVASYNSPALKKAYGMALLPAHLRPVPAEEPTKSPAVAKQSPAATKAVSMRPVTTLMTTPGRLRIQGAAGERYRVMATTDFVKWVPIKELQNEAGQVDFTDPDAGKFQQRFYRLELLTPSR